MPMFDLDRLPAAPAVLPAVTIRQFADSMFNPQVRPRLLDVIRCMLAWKQVRSLRIANSMENIIAAGFHQAVGGVGVPGLMQNIENAIDALRLSSNIAWLVTPQELDRILSAWTAAWNAGPAPAANICPTSDTTFLRYLRTYIRNHNLSMWVPRTQFDGYHENKVKLRLLQYDQVQLVNPVTTADDMNGVGRLLRLFAAGAHFVIVHSARDVPANNVPSFYNAVHNGGLQTRAARMNSHYTASYISNLNAGKYYPDFVTTETAPNANCPFILSLLIGRTASGILFNNRHNTFLQLEGWPATGTTGAGGRHGIDYQTHGTTKWNISTYGACLYSEKRGMTVFLAPPAWNPQVNPGGTIMAHYDGAHTVQGWLDRTLVR